MSNKVTFSDLVGRIAEETGASKRVIHDLLKETAVVAKEGLVRDGRLSIAGVGIFKLKWRDARQGINPQTGEPIEIPAQNQVHFRPEAALRTFINRKYQHIKPEIIRNDIKPAPSLLKSTYLFLWRKRSALGWAAALLALLLLMLVGMFSFFQPSYQRALPVGETRQPEAIPRYRIPVEELTEEKKQIQTVAQPDLSPPSAGKPGGVHNVRQGDSFWTIAKVFYADPYLWPNIFRVNVEVVDNPDALEVSTTIHVPPLEGTVGGLSQKDIMNIIDGYMQVYLAYRRLNKTNAPYYLWVAKQYNVQEVLDRYEDRIYASDRDFILRIKGSARIK
ncbi:MAG: HU family DNA-binding protein [Desulfobacterales bacterium]|nr:HU family DNA-binding protein [Desulfobacterales bacterium]